MNTITIPRYCRLISHEEERNVGDFFLMQRMVLGVGSRELTVVRYNDSDEAMALAVKGQDDIRFVNSFEEIEKFILNLINN